MQRKALSPVIASVILSGMVLVVGAGVWSYSYGAASMMANDYADTTIDMVHTISERFCIEKVHYDNTTEYIHVWVYNYGSIEINTTISIKIGDTTYPDSTYRIINSKQIERVPFYIGEPDLAPSEEVVIEIVTTKSNQESVKYYVP